MMRTVVVASTNPVKLQAAREGFARMFPGDNVTVEGVSSVSGVSDQPTSNAETLQGALNRARHAAQLAPSADFWVGIEGGIEDQDGDMQVFAWVVVLSHQRTGRGKTGTFYLPREIAELVRQGKELGDADDIVFGRSNSKQNNGAIGILTGDALDRTAYYVHAVIMALVPFKNPHLTF